MTMKSDPGLEPTRAARARISHDVGNDPEKLLQHYMEYQKRFAHRLRRGPNCDEGEAKQDIVTHVDEADRP